MPQRTITLDLPLPPKELHPNSRPHWAAKARATKKCRSETAMVAASQRTKCMPWQAATIQLTFHMPRKMDGDNANAWTKSVLDGLADAGYVENDSAFTLLPPKQVTGKSVGRKLVVEIRDAS